VEVLLKAHHRLQQENSFVKAELQACLSKERPSVGGQRFIGNKTAGVVEMHSCRVVLSKDISMPSRCESMYCHVHWTYLGRQLQMFLRQSQSMLEIEAQLAKFFHPCLQVKCVSLRPKCMPGSVLKDELACQAYYKQKCTVLRTYLASSPSAALAVQELWKLPPDVCGMHWSAQCALWLWNLQF